MKNIGLRPGTGRKGHRGGTVTIIAVLALFVLAVVAALTVDVGYIFCGQARLQNAADAAVLAAAQKVLEERRAELCEEDAQFSAESEATAIVLANWDMAGCQVAFGSYDSGQFVALGPDTPCTAVKVSAYRYGNAPGKEMPLFFASLVGRDAIGVSASAVCGITSGLKTITGGLRPFTVPAAITETVDPGDEFTFDILHGEWEPLWEGEELSPGNFGLIDLNGGAATTNELADWMLNGYDGSVTIDPDVGYTMLEGATGIRSSLQDELYSLIGQSIFITMHSQVDGNGANAEFKIVRFAGVTILDVDLTGNPKIVRMKLNKYTNVPEGETGGGMDDNLVKIHLVE